ncbi:MAG TPA: TRAP transporter small permease subunit [Candidatus Krumholzibacteria bacterium]|nr:TRAP transporter small permease subunit [Candidatus Krumholzibacteria bacterium]
MAIPSAALIVLGFVAIAVLALLRAGLERSARARRFFAFTGRIEIALIALMLLALVLFGCAQILLRNAFNSGLLWADPLMRHLVLWLGALGAALASARMRHISVDSLSRLLPPSLLPLRRLVVYGVTAVAAYALMIAAVRLIANERSYGDVAFLGIRTWVLQLVLPIAFAMITYRTVLAIFLGRESAESGLEE